MRIGIQPTNPVSPSLPTRQGVGGGSGHGDRRHSRRAAEEPVYPADTSKTVDSLSIPDFSGFPRPALPPGAVERRGPPATPDPGGPRQPLVLCDAVEQHGTTGRDVLLIFLIMGLLGFVFSTFERWPA